MNGPAPSLVASEPGRSNAVPILSMTDPILPQIAAGRAGAVDDCVKRYSGLLWGLARRSSPTVHDAEDAVQEIFMELWKSADRFDPGLSSESTFVTTIARRRLIDRTRRRSRRSGVQALDEPERIPDQATSDRTEIADEARRVSQALEKLRPEQQQVLEMALVEGHSQQEISDRIGMPLGTVKSHARRGLMRVRELLGVQGGRTSEVGP